MSVFGANTQWPVQIREERVIPIDIAVDPELRKEGVRAVVHGAAVAQLARQALGSAVLEGSAEGEIIQPGDSCGFERRNAEPPDHFGLIRGPAGEQSLSIEKPDPVFDAIASQLTVHIESRSSESSPGIRVEHGDDGAVIEID